MEHTEIEEIKRIWSEAEQIYSAADVNAALNRMAASMTEKLSEANPLFLIVMVGGAIPAGLLLPKLRFPLQVNYVHASRYSGATSGGRLHWLQRPEIDLTHRTVVILDDVLDEGLTLTAIADYCREAGAIEVFTAVVVTKDVPRGGASLSQADYSALHADGRYLFGCGMDYKNYLRNVDGIYAVKNT